MENEAQLKRRMGSHGDIRGAAGSNASLSSAGGRMDMGVSILPPTQLLKIVSV